MGKHHNQEPEEPQAADSATIDKTALRKSQAGMRFIAQMHIFNMVNWERLRTFVSDSYHEDFLQEKSIDAWMDEYQQLYEEVGRVKVKQVVGTHEHQAVVIIETEHTEDFYFMQIKVEEDYPHKITFLSLNRMQPVN